MSEANQNFLLKLDDLLKAENFFDFTIKRLFLRYLYKSNPNKHASVMWLDK